MSSLLLAPMAPVKSAEWYNLQARTESPRRRGTVGAKHFDLGTRRTWVPGHASSDFTFLSLASMAPIAQSVQRLVHKGRFWVRIPMG